MPPVHRPKLESPARVLCLAMPCKHVVLLQSVNPGAPSCLHLAMGAGMWQPIAHSCQQACWLSCSLCPAAEPRASACSMAELPTWLPKTAQTAVRSEHAIN